MEGIRGRRKKRLREEKSERRSKIGPLGIPCGA
jgi:hypothetical protein